MSSDKSVEVDAYDGLVAVDDAPAPPDEHEGQHPAIKTVCVMNTGTKTRIIPNSEPVILDNECFEGKVMLLIRTPDVDHVGFRKDPNLLTMGDRQKRISTYFKDKKRRFEFQFQIKLKRVPEGPLFLGCELGESIKIGNITRGFVGVLLAMVRRINPGFHYSWGPESTVTSEQYECGDYEKTHLSFPVEASMDRIVITKPGGTLPEMGYELKESPESVKRRRRLGAGCVDWNLEDTYTMCLWSAYADWIKWKSLNVPGMSPFSLCRVTGHQPICLSFYEIQNIDIVEYKKKNCPHKCKDLNVYTRLEFSNREKTRGGFSIFGKKRGGIIGTESLVDTESVGSDFDVKSRISHLTVS